MMTLEAVERYEDVMGHFGTETKIQWVVQCRISIEIISCRF